VPAETAITLSLEALQRVVGVYELADGRVVTVTLKASEPRSFRSPALPGQSELLAENGGAILLAWRLQRRDDFRGATDAPASSLVISMNGTQLRASGSPIDLFTIGSQPKAGGLDHASARGLRPLRETK